MAVEVLGITIYVWIAIVAFLFLVAIAVMGSFGADFGHADGGFDYGDTGPGISPISPPLLATFGTGFGSIGALLEIG
ncbi:MAG TPA: hypothetical protein VGR51_09930, partial [Thermoplasmata archaeon]|nr:hypothetical protein [Thermoplasmata archaeon]